MFFPRDHTWAFTAESLHDGEYEGNRAYERFSIHSWDLKTCRQSRRMACDEKRWIIKLDKLGKRAYFLWDSCGFHFGRGLLWKRNVNTEQKGESVDLILKTELVGNFCFLTSGQIATWAQIHQGSVDSKRCSEENPRDLDYQVQERDERGESDRWCAGLGCCIGGIKESRRFEVKEWPSELDAIHRRPELGPPSVGDWL